MEHIFITDLEFIDKEDVEYEDTLREYEESLRTGRSLKVGLYVNIYRLCDSKVRTVCYRCINGTYIYH